MLDVAIIGAGTAGLAAYRAALKRTSSVRIIEGGPYGTTCARVGCMPSKLLIAAAEAAHSAQRAELFGVEVPEVKIDGKAVMKRVRSERDRFVGFVLEGVESIPEEHRIRGCAQLVDGNTLQVGDEQIKAKSIVIATGSKPWVPPFFKELGDRLIYNDHVFEWEDLPKSVAVFGLGVIGLELGQALDRLGVRVRMFGKGGTLGPLSDPEVKKSGLEAFAKELSLDTNAEVLSVERRDDLVWIRFVDKDGQEKEESFEYLFASTGRRPNLEGLNLSAAGVKLDEKGLPSFDSSTMQVGNSSLFIAGDVNNERPLLHEAADEGKIAGENAATYPRVNHFPRSSPLGVVFSDPQIAMVGQRHSNLDLAGSVIGEVSFSNQGRSRVMGLNQGLLRIYAHASTGRFLGAEMVGPRAEHIGHLLAWAHQQQLSIEQMLTMPFYHPVIEEGVRTALRNTQKALENYQPLAEIA